MNSEILEEFDIHYIEIKTETIGVKHLLKDSICALNLEKKPS